MALRDPQTWQFLKGDLEPRRVMWSDLRNDFAGDGMQQAQSIVLRYLENLPAQDTVSMEAMVADICRHYPFHGKGVDFFKDAVDALKDLGWVKIEDGELELDKIARVTDRYLKAKISLSR